jgi:predicted nucleotidyltransferase
MSRLDLQRVLKQIEPNLSPTRDEWSRNSLRNLVTELLASGDFKSEKQANEIRRFAYSNVTTSVDKINGAEDTVTEYLKKYGATTRSEDFVRSLICVVIGSCARFESESQSDIDFDLVVDESISNYDSFRTHVKEVRRDLNRRFKFRETEFLSFHTEHFRPYPLKGLRLRSHLCNMIIGSHAIGDPTRIERVLSTAVRTVDKNEVITHLINRVKREIGKMAKEEECDPVKVGYAVMMYTIRILALKFKNIEYLYDPIPKPYWKICDDLYGVSGLSGGILRRCASSIKAIMLFRYEQDQERTRKDELPLSDNDEEDILSLIQTSFNSVEADDPLRS